MKKMLLIAIMGVLAVTVRAQDADKISDKNVPQSVKASFDNQFPNSIVIDWKVKDGNYKATFTTGMKKHIAEFNNLGELISRGEKISKDELPTGVSEAVRQSFASSDIDEIYRIEK